MVCACVCTSVSARLCVHICVCMSACSYLRVGACGCLQKTDKGLNHSLHCKSVPVNNETLNMQIRAMFRILKTGMHLLHILVF